MKEMIGARHQYDGQFQRLRPGHDVGQRHGFVVGAVDDDGVGGDGLRVVSAHAFDDAGGGTDQHQPLGRVARCDEGAGDTGDDLRVQVVTDILERVDQTKDAEELKAVWQAALKVLQAAGDKVGYEVVKAAVLAKQQNQETPQ